jgi:hypothetical protein
MKRPVSKKKPTVPPDEQSKRFVADAQRMIDAGELKLTEVNRALDSIVRLSASKPNDTR